MNASGVKEWFDGYLEAFAACGRGEREAACLLGYWAVPLLVATGDGFTALTSRDEVLAVARQQINGMLAAAYDHSEILGSDVTVFNATAALYKGQFARRRADGNEINRVQAS